MSIVKRVEAELNMEVRSLIRAANITAIITPRIPSGRRRNTKYGYAKLVPEKLYSLLKAHTHTVVAKDNPRNRA